MTIVKPRKIVWVMRDFINAVSDLEYILEADFDGEKYSNTIKAKRTVKLVEGKHLSATPCGKTLKSILLFSITLMIYIIIQ